MLYNKKNYILMGVSVLLIFIGFILMSGGSSTDGVSFSEAIFSTRRIVIAPFICFSGFILMIYAIIAKPSKKSQDKKQAR